jgi:hypothetical protein
MREKNSYNCSVSRLARGTPPAYPYLMLRHTVYILYPYTNEFPVFFSTVIFFIQIYSHVYWSNSPLLLNYTYTVVWFYLPMILDQGSLSCSTLFLQQPPLRQRPSLRQRIRWSSWRHVISSRTLAVAVRSFVGAGPVSGRDSVHGWPYSNDHHGGLGSSYSPQPCTMWGFMWNHVKPGRFFSYIIFAAWFGLCPAWTFCVHRHASLHSQWMPISSNFKF